MSLAIHLLGQPRIDRPGADVYRFRSRKSWALLAYLLLNDRRPSRSQLAALLFPDADDPIRALRWSLSELRRGLGADASVLGDPLVLRLPKGAVVDVDVVVRGAWSEAVELPGLGSELLDGQTQKAAAAFETWLLAERRHLAAASEAILHEAALGSMSRGDLQEAIGYAVRATVMSPLDENHQALLIRLYRLAGDDEAAAAQLAACTELFRAELGVAPGPAVQGAIRENRQVGRREAADEPTIAALVEAGSAAVSAGVVDAGVTSLRTAARLADDVDSTALRIRARITLAEALIHSQGGLDEHGLAALFEADTIALASDAPAAAAEARAELGYVDYLRARYSRAEIWLTDALDLAGDDLAVRSKATTYLGSVASDRGDYPRAAALLTDAIGLCQQAKDLRREAFARSILGRLHLLRGELDAAADELDASAAAAEKDHWLAFLPWPQAHRGEVQLRRGDVNGAAELLEQAFARACQLGNPCWEGTAARGLAMVAEARGNPARAFMILADASARSSRLSDPYVWLAAYILDARCELGRKHGHPDTLRWIERMKDLTARTGMRELAVRALLHGAALGTDGDAEAAAMLAVGLDNPELEALLGPLPASA